jgi:hypothetical protein
MAVSLTEDDFIELARIEYGTTPWFVGFGAANDLASGRRPGLAKQTVAAAYAAASAGDLIVIGNGTFTGNLTITSGKPIRLKGAGIGKTTLKAADAGFDAAVHALDYCEIEDMTISGSADGLSGPVQWSPSALPHQIVTLRRVRLYHRSLETVLNGANQQGSAIYVYGVSSTDSTALVLDDCEIDADGYGIYAEDIHTIVLRNTRIWATVCAAPGGAEAALLASNCEFNYFQRGAMTSGNTAKGIALAGKNALVDACSFNGYPNTTGANVAIETEFATAQAVVTNSVINHSANSTSKSFIVATGSAVYVDAATRYDTTRNTVSGTGTLTNNINTIRRAVQAHKDS